MDITLLKRVEWTVEDRHFILTRSTNDAILQSPDGMTITLTLAEWHRLADALTRLGLSKLRAPESRADLPTSAGLPWSIALDDQLTSLWNEGQTVRALADLFGRTPGAITSRLVRIGLVEQRSDTNSRKS